MRWLISGTCGRSGDLIPQRSFGGLAEGTGWEGYGFGLRGSGVPNEVGEGLAKHKLCLPSPAQFSDLACSCHMGLAFTKSADIGALSVAPL